MEITSKELKQKIENGDKIIIDFWGVWCSPCKIMKPIFEKVAEEYRKENAEIQLYTMDVDKNRETISNLGIRNIPTIKSFNGGKEVESRTGVLQEEQLNEMVKTLLNG